MALKIIDYGSPEYQQMVKLRDAVLRKPLGLTFTQDDLESEKDNILIAAFEEEPAAVRRGAAQGPADDLSAAGRLSKAWPVRHRNQRLVPAFGAACR